MTDNQRGPSSTAPGAFPLTDLPFAVAEYERRLAAVRGSFERFAIDGMAATRSESLQYLTGYAAAAGNYFAPFPLVISPAKPPTYVVRTFDEESVLAQSWITDVRTYAQQGDLASAWADALRRQGLDHGRLGLEMFAWNLAPGDVTALQQLLPDLEIVDATRLVPLVAAVKSPVEIQAMRESAALTDIAAQTFFGSIHEGVSEQEVADAIEDAVTAAGGQNRSEFGLVFGHRTALPHGAPSDNRIARDELAFTEVGGIKQGYVTLVCRSAVLGSHPEGEALHSLAEEALAAAIEALRPGRTCGEVDRAVRAVLEREGKLDAFRHRTGYHLGIDSSRGDLSLEPGATEIIEEGMTFHVPIILFEAGQFSVGTSETVLVTSNGAEVLGTTSSSIQRIT